MAEKTLSYLPWQLPPCSPPKMLSVAHAVRVLVLVPHPDDEVLGCGGLLTELAQLHIPTRVILVTNGDGAGGLPAGADQTRQAEFAQAMATLGNTLEHTCWKLPDGGLADVTDLDERLEHELSVYQPSLVVAPWPGDMHPDHAVLGRWVGERHAQQPLPQGVLFYEVWSPLPATHVLDISAHWPRKQAALDCHATALACGDYHRAMQGLASYRSLLAGNMAREGHFTEAYYGCDVRLSEGDANTPYYRMAQRQDGDAVAALFQQLFESATPPGWWEWKYAGQAHPGSAALHFTHGLVGFYGAQARQAQWQGSALTVCQQGDVMVAPGYRFATRQRGVFATLSRMFLTKFMGPGRPYALSFGFPTPRAMKLGEHLGLYQAADYLQQHVWPVKRRWLEYVMGTRIELTPASTQDDWQWLNQLNALPSNDNGFFWLEKRPEDWAWRFGQHPEKTYHLLRVFRRGQCCGAAILQAHQGGALELMDMALSSPANRKALWHGLDEAARRLGFTVLSAWGTQSALDCLPPGERSGAGQLALPGPALEAPLATDVKGRCWLLGGDTDFR